MQATHYKRHHQCPFEDAFTVPGAGGKAADIEREWFRPDAGDRRESPGNRRREWRTGASGKQGEMRVGIGGVPGKRAISQRALKASRCHILPLILCNRVLDTMLPSHAARIPAQANRPERGELYWKDSCQFLQFAQTKSRLRDVPAESVNKQRSQAPTAAF